MKDLQILEECYKKFTKELNKYIPEGIHLVDLETLQKFHLLKFHTLDANDPGLTRYFHVIESDEKITLVNEQFVVWIIPDVLHEAPITYTLIALNSGEKLRLETAFATTGVYNSSKLVLRLLEKHLFEIQETEDMLSHLNRKS